MPKISVAVLLIFFLACSCQTRPQGETSASTSAPDSATMLASRPAPDAPRSAADRLVRALYFEHSKTENPLLETRNRLLIDQFFSKPTADLIWRDASMPSGKLNRAKTNPLFDAPNESIKKIWVLPAAVGGSKAVVYVTFEQNGKPREIRIDMQQLAGRWRIVDMVYPDGKRLTQRIA